MAWTAAARAAAALSGQLHGVCHCTPSAATAVGGAHSSLSLAQLASSKSSETNAEAHSSWCAVSTVGVVGGSAYKEAMQCLAAEQLNCISCYCHAKTMLMTLVKAVIGAECDILLLCCCCAVAGAGDPQDAAHC